MSVKGSEYLGFYNAKATVAFFSSIIATIFAAFYWFGRLGFGDNSIFVILKVLSISYFLLFLPSAVRKARAYLGLSFEKSWYSSDAAISLLGLLLVILIGFLIPSFSMIAFAPFVLLGFLFFAINLIDYFSSNTTKNNLIFCFYAILFSILMVFIHSSNQGSTPPLVFEDLVTEHKPGDTLFHCAIAQMIKTYGIPSTGLDGVPYAPYHFGSHFIFAQISKLINLNIFTFYRLGFITIFIPFLFNCILSFIVDLRKYFGYPMENWNLKTDYKFWVILGVPFVGFLPIRILNRLYTKEWILVSESYALGTSLLFIAASLLIYFFEKFKSERGSLKSSDLAFFILALPLLVGIMGLVKQSHSFLFIVILAYLFFRSGLHKNKILVFSSLIILTVSFLVYNLVTHRYSGVFKLVFFDQIKRFVIADKINQPFFWITLIPGFYLVHFFWSWLYIALRLLEENIKKIADFKVAFKKRRTIDIEILFLLCLIGALPGILLKVRGGVTIYFSDLQRWVAVSFLLSRFYSFPLFYMKLETTRIKKVILFSLLFVAGVSFLSNIVISGKNTVERYITVRNSLSNLSLDKNQKYKMYKTLVELDKIPLRDKRRTLLFIPKSNRLYWDSLNPYTIPLIGPALTGIAMVDGLSEVPISSEFPLHQWAYYIYKVHSNSQSLAESTPDKVYSKVLEKGFSKLIVIEYKNGETVVTKIQ